MYNVADLIENVQHARMARFNSLVADSPRVPRKNSKEEWVYAGQDADGNMKSVRVKPPECVDVKRSIVAHNADVRKCITDCCIAEHDVVTCADNEVREKSADYYATLDKLDYALQAAVTAASYDAVVNQVVNKAEIADIIKERNLASIRRGRAQMKLVLGENKKREAKEYLESTHELIRIRDEYQSINLCEVRQMILAVPEFHTETKNEFSKRMRNLEMKQKVKGSLLSKKECMKKKKAVLLKEVDVIDKRATKEDLCELLLGKEDDDVKIVDVIIKKREKPRKEDL